MDGARLAIPRDRLRLTVEKENYLFEFELYLEHPAAGLPAALRFSYPTIIERYGTARAARVRSL